ncbi:MAG: alpha-amylase family glycosyl hydrolase, partial [Bacilli bacterium]|nr:alpha-amylase family glycosyl hydrolase [Bacilli bacterium]
YSIKDYYEINPELGGEASFDNLIKKAHEKGLKVMIDIVFNHTSRDSKIYKEHNSWMYHNLEGKEANKMGDWSDVYDLDLTNDELCDYLVRVIEHYCKKGVDGFRFDVASLLTKKFYIKLRKMLDEKYPSTILLAESVHIGFVNYGRSLGFNVLSDQELVDYGGFDLLYQYNTIEPLTNYLNNGDKIELDRYKALLLSDLGSLSSSALRIRGLENHDQKRLIEYTSSLTRMKNLLAFQNFMRGPLFIYNGLETKADHVLSLFTKDLLDLSIDEKWFTFVKKMIEFKKNEKDLLISIPLLTLGENLAVVNHYKDHKLLGLFSLGESSSSIEHKDIEDGEYLDLISGQKVVIKNHSLEVKEPLFLKKI